MTTQKFHNEKGRARSSSGAQKMSVGAAVLALSVVFVQRLVWTNARSSPIELVEVDLSTSVNGEHHKDGTVEGEVVHDNAPTPAPVDAPVMDLPVVVQNVIRPLSEQATKQARHYKLGKGLILNLHVTHHGGTTVCEQLGTHSNGGQAPPFACMVRVKDDPVGDAYPYDRPWFANETAANVEYVRRYYHMVSWEFAGPEEPPLSETNWDDPNLFSIYVARHPLSRMLAGDAYVSTNYPDVLLGTADGTTLKAWAHDDCNDNYNLRILTNRSCCDGADTTIEYLQQAKALLTRFSVVIDIECLGETLQLLASNELNLQVDPDPHHARKKKSIMERIKERITDDHIYDYLMARNAMDIELYEWAKKHSYLDCSKFTKNKPDFL